MLRQLSNSLGRAITSQPQSRFPKSCAAFFSTHQDSSGTSTSDDSSSDEALRFELLEGALSLVQQEGWSRRAIERAALDRGLSASAAGILERGEGQLVEHFVSRCNDELNAELAAMADELKAMPIRERIRWAVQRRLEMVQPYIDSWPQVRLCIDLKFSNYFAS